jgi:hypothetical protein
MGIEIFRKEEMNGIMLSKEKTNEYPLKMEVLLFSFHNSENGCL